MAIQNYLTSMTTKEQIQQSRAEIESQKAELKKSLAVYKPLRRIYSKEKQITPQQRRLQREQSRVEKLEISKQEAQLLKSEAEFETQIAQYAPSLAKEKQFQKSYDKASSDINQQINVLNNQLADKTTSKSKYIKWYNNLSSEQQSDRQYSFDKRLESYDAQITGYRNKLNFYQQSVKGDKEDFVKKYYAGYIDEYSDYLFQVAISRGEKQIANVTFRQDVAAGKIQLPPLADPKKISTISAYNKSIADYQNLLNKTSSSSDLRTLSLSNLSAVYGKDFATFVKDNKNLKIITDKSGNPVGVEDNIKKMSYSWGNYIKEQERLQKVYPDVGTVGIKQVASTLPLLIPSPSPELSLRAQQMQVSVIPEKEKYTAYVYPGTKTPIPDINKYLVEHKIPVEKQTFDFLGLSKMTAQEAFALSIKQAKAEKEFDIKKVPLDLNQLKIEYENLLQQEKVLDRQQQVSLGMNVYKTIVNANILTLLTIKDKSLVATGFSIRQSSLVLIAKTIGLPAYVKLLNVRLSDRNLVGDYVNRAGIEYGFKKLKKNEQGKFTLQSIKGAYSVKVPYGYYKENVSRIFDTVAYIYNNLPKVIDKPLLKLFNTAGVDMKEEQYKQLFGEMIAIKIIDINKKKIKKITLNDIKKLAKYKGVPDELINKIPDTPGEIVISAGKVYLFYQLLGAIGLAKTLTFGSFVYSKPIVTGLEKIRPSDRLGSYLFNIGTYTVAPTVIKTAYGTEFLKEFAKDPPKASKELWRTVKERPEILTVPAVAKGIRMSIDIAYGKYVSGKYVPVKEIKLPDGTKIKYAELKLPDGKINRAILLDKTPKVELVKQLTQTNKLKGYTTTIHVAPGQLKLVKGKLTINEPRGLYTSAAKQVINQKYSQALLEYGGGIRREIGLGSYIYKKLIKGERIKVGKEVKPAFEIFIEQSPKLSTWIKKVVKNKSIKGYEKPINYWSKKFDIQNPPKSIMEWRTSTGTATGTIEVWLNEAIGQGVRKLTPAEIKLAKALYQWSRETKTALPVGTELITAYVFKKTPRYGFEEQIVQPFKKEFVKTPKEQFTYVEGQRVPIRYFEPAKILKDKIVEIKVKPEIKRTAIQRGHDAAGVMNEMLTGTRRRPEVVTIKKPIVPVKRVIEERRREEFARRDIARPLVNRLIGRRFEERVPERPREVIRKVERPRLVRLTPRVPERPKPRITERPRVPERPKPRITERPRVPERPRIPILRLIPPIKKEVKKIPKKVIKKVKKKKRKYILEPTLANILYKAKRRVPIKLGEVTGLEALRI